MLVTEELPVAPVQLSKIYSAAGVAVIEAVSPSLYCLVIGDTIPPSFGMAFVVKVYFMGSEEQEKRNETENNKINFFIF
jgi:hypothetical protein